MDADLILMIEQHKWFALGAVLVGGLVRLAKADAFGSWFRTLPSLWKRIIPLALGGAVGVLESLASGRPLTEALVKGALLAGGGAMIGQDLIIEGIRGGREIGE